MNTFGACGKSFSTSEGLIQTFFKLAIIIRKPYSVVVFLLLRQGMYELNFYDECYD